MARKVRWRFYDHKLDYLVIPAFRTRIDKSKGPRRRRHSDPPEDDAIDGKSKYFSHLDNSTDQDSLDSTLLDEEAKEYGYKKVINFYEDPKARAEAVRQWHSKKGRRLPFSTPFTVLGLIEAHETNKKNLISLAKGNEKDSTLREQLDKNILRMTRVSMNYACKQYPSLPSRNQLDKHAFLFGLKPNSTIG